MIPEIFELLSNISTIVAALLSIILSLISLKVIYKKNQQDSKKKNRKPSLLYSKEEFEAVND